MPVKNHSAPQTHKKGFLRLWNKKISNGDFQECTDICR